MTQGFLSKMPVVWGEDNTVQYALPVSGELVPLNPLVGQSIRLTYTGNIQCVACGRATKKSWSQGYCFPCTQRLAQCDMCIMKPEQCHFHLGTCREPEWGEQHCMQDHVIYLANSSGLKVGITRMKNVPSRWMDQGAIAALPILQVSTRRLSGLIEVEIAKHISDKTNWRKMLKNEVEPVDLIAKKEELLERCAAQIEAITTMGIGEVQELPDDNVYTFQYPVIEYPTKVTSFNFDKNPEVSGTLMGIKGQYLLLDTGVINIRKFGGYEVVFEFSQKGGVR